MANSGFEHLSGGCNSLFIKIFIGYDYTVAPSGSCILHIKEHFKDEKQLALSQHIKEITYEVTAFLTDVLKINTLNSSFHYEVGMHQNCHGQRGLSFRRWPSWMHPIFLNLCTS